VPVLPFSRGQLSELVIGRLQDGVQITGNLFGRHLQHGQRSQGSPMERRVAEQSRHKRRLGRRERVTSIKGFAVVVIVSSTTSSTRAERRESEEQKRRPNL